MHYKTESFSFAYFLKFHIVKMIPIHTDQQKTAKKNNVLWYQIVKKHVQYMNTASLFSQISLFIVYTEMTISIV